MRHRTPGMLRTWRSRPATDAPCPRSWRSSSPSRPFPRSQPQQQLEPSRTSSRPTPPPDRFSPPRRPWNPPASRRARQPSRSRLRPGVPEVVEPAEPAAVGHQPTTRTPLSAAAAAQAAAAKAAAKKVAAAKAGGRGCEGRRDQGGRREEGRRCEGSREGRRCEEGCRRKGEERLVGRSKGLLLGQEPRLDPGPSHQPVGPVVPVRAQPSTRQLHVPLGLRRFEQRLPDGARLRRHEGPPRRVRPRTALEGHEGLVRRFQRKGAPVRRQVVEAHPAHQRCIVGLGPAVGAVDDAPDVRRQERASTG